MELTLLEWKDNKMFVYWRSRRKPKYKNPMRMKRTEILCVLKWYSKDYVKAKIEQSHLHLFHSLEVKKGTQIDLLAFSLCPFTLSFTKPFFQCSMKNKFRSVFPHRFFFIRFMAWLLTQPYISADICSNIYCHRL